MELERLIIDRYFINPNGFGCYTYSGQAYTRKRPINLFEISAHIQGKQIIGCLPTFGLSCGWLCIDIDCHEAKQQFFENGDKERFRQAKQTLFNSQVLPLFIWLCENEIRPMIEDSFGGFHIWVLFQRLPLKMVQKAKEVILAQFPSLDEIFPKSADRRKLGNWVRFPGKYPKGRFCSYILHQSQWVRCNNKAVFGLIANWPNSDLTLLISKHVEKPQRQPTTVEIQKTSCKQQGNKSQFFNWITEQLQAIDLVDYIACNYGSNNFKKEQNGSISCYCPLHSDRSKSAYITNHNGVDFLHCSSTNCQANGLGLTALNLELLQNGRNYKLAFLKLFGCLYKEE